MIGLKEQAQIVEVMCTPMLPAVPRICSGMFSKQRGDMG